MANTVHDIIKEALDKGRAEKREEEIEYYRFLKKTGAIARGTVIVGNRIIFGYPKIKRIFTLEKGIKRNINAETIYIEEKIDGFNIRVANIDNSIYAFSRGGFIEPFSTEKVREIRLESFFSDNSEKVLCGEMIGNTPYTEPTKKYDVKFLVFDIDAGDGSYLPVEEKYRLLDRYGIESVPRLGKFKKEDLNAIAKVALSLNKAGKEGIVIKAKDRRTLVKYVNIGSDIEDIEKSAARIFDMPLGFFEQRIMRSSIFLKDFTLDKRQYSKRLGNALYSGLLKGLQQVEKDGHVYEEFEVLIKNQDVWQHMLKHMGKEVRIEETDRKEEKNGTRIRFKKIYKKSSSTFRHCLSGKAVED